MPDITPNQNKDRYILYSFYYLLTMYYLQDYVASTGDSIIQ